MIKVAAPIISAFLLTSCNTPDDGSGLSKADRQAMEKIAVQKVGCVIEKQDRCSHIIENRTQLALYFAPDVVTQKLKAKDKIKGKRVTRNFVVEAVAGINQCITTEADSLPLIKNMEIAGELYELKGTSPLSEVSQCYLVKQQGGS